MAFKINFEFITNIFLVLGIYVAQKAYVHEIRRVFENFGKKGHGRGFPIQSGHFRVFIVDQSRGARY